MIKNSEGGEFIEENHSAIKEKADISNYLILFYF
jgi:hypothetical protein